MNLRSPYPYWLLKNGLIHEYPSLFKNIETETVILGGGISGALLAHELTSRGREAIVVDGRHIAMGSTSASTSMLQYEIDTPMHKLAKLVGLKNAVTSYKLCIEAIDQIEDIAKSLNDHCDFERKPSLQFASRVNHLKALSDEFEIRKKHGIEIELLSQNEVKQKFGFDAPGAIYSPHNGAQLDAYKLAHKLILASLNSGLQAYDKTRVEKIEFGKKKVTLKTVYGQKIKAQNLIMATGYESYEYFSKSLLTLSSTYALVSEPYENIKLWPEEALIWETANPYLYMRTTSDNRILVGGKDEPFYNPAKRDDLIAAKTRDLCRSFEKLFPRFAPLRVDFSWAGTFASTPDSLPYIGKVKKYPNTWFALGFGGNGILFSQIAARIIVDALLGKKNNNAEIFDFSRANK